MNARSPQTHTRSDPEAAQRLKPAWTADSRGEIPGRARRRQKSRKRLTPWRRLLSSNISALDLLAVRRQLRQALQRRIRSLLAQILQRDGRLALVHRDAVEVRALVGGGLRPAILQPAFISVDPAAAPG